MPRLVYFMSGYELQAERAKAGLTQQQLAEKANCHIQTVRFWEAERDRDNSGGLYSKAVGKMCGALGLEPLGEGPTQSVNACRISKEDLEELGLGWFYQKCRPKSPRHCNAITPSGRKCRKRPPRGQMRCNQHGGLSTGPKTEEGKERIAAAQRKRWAEHKAGKTVNHVGTQS